MIERLAASYVTHAGREWLVSTINRPSSALDDAVNCAETMVWPVDHEQKRTQQACVYQCEDICGSVFSHCQVVLKIAAGKMDFQQDVEVSP